MYRSYRGSRGRIGCLIPILVVLCVCAALVLLFLHNNLAFTSEGMALTLPFSGREIIIGSSEPEQTPVLIIEQNTGEPEPDNTLTPPENDEHLQPVDEYKTRNEKSVFVPFEVLIDTDEFDELYSKLSIDRFDTVILEVKAESGKLAFDSSSKLSQAAGAGSEDNSTLKNILTKLTRDGYNVTAELSCFRDNLAARRSQAYAARTKNRVIWLDYDNITWLNPYTEEAREYIIELIDELYILGFTELLLTNISFPYHGQTHILYYPDEDDGAKKQDAISDFLAELLEFTQDKLDLRISARHDYPREENNVAPGGQVLSDLVDSFYRIYAEVARLDGARGLDPEIFEEYREKIGETDFEYRFVPIVTVGEKGSLSEIFDCIYTAQSYSTGFSLYNKTGKYPIELVSATVPSEN